MAFFEGRVPMKLLHTKAGRVVRVIRLLKLQSNGDGPLVVHGRSPEHVKPVNGVEALPVPERVAELCQLPVRAL